MTDWYGKPSTPGDPPPDPPPTPPRRDDGEEEDGDSKLEAELPDEDHEDDDDGDALASSSPGSRPLAGHQPLTTGGGGGLCCGLIFGLLFLVAGLAGLAHAQGVLLGWAPQLAEVVNELDANAQGLRWDLMAPPVALLGIIIIANTIGSNIRTARKRMGVVGRPEEPWQHDHPWDPERGTDRAAVGVSGFMGLLSFGLFLFPFHVPLVQFGSGEGAVVAWVILGFFDLLWVLVGLYMVYAFLRARKYAGGELRWAQFPYMVGQPVKLTLQLPPALLSLIDRPTIEVALRCLHDQWITTGSGKNRSTSRAVMLLHELRAPADSPGGEDRLQLSFELPPGVPSTDLISSDPTYWELEVKAETPGIDYLAQYLVPIY